MSSTRVRPATYPMKEEFTGFQPYLPAWQGAFVRIGAQA